jgi:hypothetical protein
MEAELVRRGTIGCLGAAVAMVAMLGGCRDSGLPDRNLPLEEARTRPFRYSVYEPASVPPVRVADRDWIAAGLPMSIPQRLLTPVTPDGNVFALASDASPWTRLYRRSAAGYTPLAPLP